MLRRAFEVLKMQGRAGAGELECVNRLESSVLN